MDKVGDPFFNLLAQAGLVSNQSGRIFEPPFGPFYAPWLVDVTAETRSLAQSRLQECQSLPEEVRLGWFITSTEAEFAGLKELLSENWRAALRCWKGDGLYCVHNRATLHRALYYSGSSERPDAHIRECLRLYYHLSESAPKQKFYRFVQEELIEHLKLSIQESHDSGNDESASKSLKILSQTVGLVAVEHLQQQLFKTELTQLRVQTAKLQQELLSYQGLAHAPPLDLLAQCEEALSKQIVPVAARFSHKLLEGSQAKAEVEGLVARACGILSQSYSKASDPRAAKRWMREALRWEPTAVKDWRSLPDEEFGDEDSARVTFPEQQKEKKEFPKQIGSFLLGLKAVPVAREAGETREEWLESVFLAFLPLIPIRRFAGYRNLDTEEMGYFVRIPLTVLDHLRQGVAVLLMSFVLTLSGIAVSNQFKKFVTIEHSMTKEEMSEGIEQTLLELKNIAQEEARLNDLEKPNEDQLKRIEVIQAERSKLMNRLQELEKMRSQ